MLKIKSGDTVFELKNSLDEFLIGEFQHICTILNDTDVTKTKIDKWSEVFIFLGLPREICEELDAFYFIEIMKSFELIGDTSEEMINEFQIDGYTYVSFDDKLKITIKEMAFIESFIEKGDMSYVSDMMAVLFKRTDLTRVEHLDKAHIKQKSKLIKENIKANVAMPYVSFLFKKLMINVDVTQDLINGGI